MSQRKIRNRLSQKDTNKINNRYLTKYQEFAKLTIDELESKTGDKMSHTDRLALKHAKQIKQAKELKKNGDDQSDAE